MRISGGVARGTILQTPRGDATRPATDGMRQSVFSALGARVLDARCLDLFAGSGGYGLEAFSRGAAAVVFVESQAKVAACIRQNIVAVAKSAGRAAGALRVCVGDALTWAPVGGEPRPDLCFVDPPYELIPRLAAPLFARLAEATVDAADPLIVFEYPGELELAPEGWTLLKRIGHGAGQPTVGFFRRGLRP
jgi:16S rRNA (guanine966-N2)-methyltransferase